MKNDWLITIVLFLPLIGLLPILLLPKARENQVKWVTLFFSGITFLASLLLLGSFDSNIAGMQHEHLANWISFGTFQVNYYVGVDGLSILLVLLTTFIMPLAIMFSLESIKDRVRLFYAFLLILEFTMIGVVVAQGLFLFFVFGEVSVVPMYFVVGIWGSEQRIYAAVKLFLYT